MWVKLYIFSIFDLWCCKNIIFLVLLCNCCYFLILCLSVCCVVVGKLLLCDLYRWLNMFIGVINLFCCKIGIMIFFYIVLRGFGLVCYWCFVWLGWWWLFLICLVELIEIFVLLVVIFCVKFFLNFIYNLICFFVMWFFDMLFFLNCCVEF